MFDIPRVSPQRGRTIVREIASGSRMQSRFFVLLIAASMIAAFGLIANSTAVIIGAMLVSPLMTPIFGIALGMLRGNPRLLWRSLASESIGVILAIGSALLVGLVPQLAFAGATEEMLSRTQPNLVDLFVAVFAGFAGAYALVDERVSPALPGVAIATAIVPPLSTCGLCLALGAWSGAAGALLLFLANFVSIHLVALLVFWVGGLGRAHRRTARRVAAHLTPTVTAFVLMVVILTNSLTRIIQDRTLKVGIQTTLTQQLAQLHWASLMEFIHRHDAAGGQVLATVRSQRTISPARVSAIQHAIGEAIGRPVDLVVRTMRSRDVSPLGSSLQAMPPDFNGNFLETVSLDDVSRETLASQVIREFFEQEPGFELTRIEYGETKWGHGVVVAYVNSIRRFRRDEIGIVENLLRNRLREPNLHFLFRVDSERLVGVGGAVLSEWTNVNSADPDHVAQIPELTAVLQSIVEESLQLIPLQTHFNWMDGRWQALVEVTGPREVTVDDANYVQRNLPENFRDHVDILIWRRSNYVATTSGYTTYDQLTDPLIEERRQKLYELFRTGFIPPPAQGVSANADL